MHTHIYVHTVETLSTFFLLFPLPVEVFAQGMGRGPFLHFNRPSWLCATTLDEYTVGQ